MFRAVMGAGVWAVLLLPCDADAQAVQPSNARLLEILQARVRAVHSFQADVRTSEAPGADRLKLAADAREVTSWVEANKPNAQASVKEWAEALDKPPDPSTRFCRHYARVPKLRQEDFGSIAPGHAAATAAFILVYNGDRWLESFHSPLQTPQAVSTLAIHERERRNSPHLEIARGAAVFNFPSMNLTSTSEAIRQVWWEDLFSRASPRSIEETRDFLPTGGPPLPVLQLGAIYDPQKGLNLYRVRVWFDPAQGFEPVRLES